MADERLRCGERVRVIGPAATSPGDTFAIGKETTVAELRVDDDGHTVYACQIRGWGFVPFPRASLERIDEVTQPANEPLSELRQAIDDAVLTHTGRSIGDLASQRVLDDIMPCIAALLATQTNEPRALIQAFARLGMERKLAANDGVKGGWRDADWIDHYCALLAEIGELVAALSVLEDYQQHGVVEDEARQAVLDEAADCANYLMMICDVVGALPPTDERGR